MNIPLGYEIGSGKRVTIPVNHTVVLGQTQLSGKTTTLEAMVERSGLRAIGFITKPGEKSFRLQTQIPAFFSESTIEEYWKHVVAILEYRAGTRLGWRERGVVMKLCQDYKKETSRIGMDKSGKSKREAVKYSWRAPRSLRALLENIGAWMPFARGQEEMICIQLREYLKPAIEEIESADFSDKLNLAPGINVMDVTNLSDGLKSLVIRSVIEWVHKRGRKIVVIIPEAWKFIPEGRSTPVKLALEGLIREGAGVENFVWMDSQDLRGVDKMLLRSVIVWLFGVQRQKNEVASTLASIPDHPKPTATEVMQLGKGQFYVCYGTTLKHTYVQPAGMEDAHAQAIARGDESPDSWRQIERALEVQDGEAASAMGDSQRPDYSGDKEGGEGMARDAERESSLAGPDPDPSGINGEDETVWKEKYEELKAEYDTLVEAHDALAERVRALQGFPASSLESSTSRPPSGASRLLGAGEDEGEAADSRKGLGAAASASADGRPAHYDLNFIYDEIKHRAQKDPGILELLARRPELRVTVERPTIEVNGDTLRGALATLILKKFFDSPQNANTAFNELKRLGRRVAKPGVYRELDKLAELGFVTKEETGYQAVAGMKIHIIEEKSGKAVAAR